mmetsp:Transcript_23579/g.65403  ORF Transcript_23579/g.65403 Transcript_23579/m.65403 type:complete len:329 (+) Transcript_23579:1910-2896(+)
MPSAARTAAVSVSISPACPMDSRTWARGYRLEAVHSTTRADTRRWASPEAFWQSSSSASLMAPGRVWHFTIIFGRRGSEGTRNATPLASDIMDPTTNSRRGEGLRMATMRPVSLKCGFASRWAAHSATTSAGPLAAGGLPDAGSDSSSGLSTASSPSSSASGSFTSNLSLPPASSLVPLLLLCMLCHSAFGRSSTATSSPTMARFWFDIPLMRISAPRPSMETNPSRLLLALQRYGARNTSPFFMAACSSACSQCSWKRALLVRALFFFLRLPMAPLATPEEPSGSVPASATSAGSSGFFPVGALRPQRPPCFPGTETPCAPPLSPPS